MRHIWLVSTCIICLKALPCNAQVAKDTTIKGSTIEIIQSYKPQVKQTPKPEIAPLLPPSDTIHPKFDYIVPQQSLYYTYNSPALKPLALGSDSMENFYPNYVKIGAGNLSTIYLDAALSKIKWKDYEGIVHINHISQEGSLKYQQTSLSGIDAEGTVHRNGNAWHGFADGSIDQYHYYGYDHDVYSPSTDSVKQTFTGIHLGLDMQNEKAGYMGINYHPAVFASFYRDAFSANESTLGFNIPISKTIDESLEVTGAINATVTQLAVNSKSNGNNIFAISPGINFNKQNWGIRAVLSPTAGNSGIYLLPDIDLHYRLQSIYLLNAGWQATLKQNTYEQLSTENPYIYNTYAMHQTQSNELYAGIKGSMGNHIFFSGRLSWWQYSKMPVFLNDSGEQKQFYIIWYDKVNNVSIQANARYDVADIFSAGIGMHYNKYSSDNGTVWHEPSFIVKGDLVICPIAKLTCTAYLSVLSGMKALNAQHEETSLPTTLDIGGNASYQIINRLSVFLQINNLLNNKNERWLGYQSYGLNIYGGLRLIF